MAHPKPVSGYAYALKHSTAAKFNGWRRADDEFWDTVVITPSSDYLWVGRRYVDQSEVNVWDTGRRYVAQTTVMTGRALQANPVSGTALVVGALAAGGLVWWLTRSSEASAAPTTPTTPPCPITEAMLQAFVTKKQYGLYWPKDGRSVAQWNPPDPKAFNSKTRAFSTPDCGFYKWDGTKWVVDDATNKELAASINATMSGHPADLFMF